MVDRTELMDDPEEAQRAAQDGLQARIWTTMPGIVDSYDPVRQTVSVQPAIKGIITGQDGTPALVNMPLLVDVPVMFVRAGGFAITHPINQGDECLVSFAARCIDSWWQSGGVQAPLEARMHDLSDGFAFFAPTSQPKKLADVQTDGLELRTEDRAVFIKLTADKILINGNIEHTGNTKHTGALDHVGNTLQTGTFVGDVVRTTAGTGLGTHDHGSGALISGKTPAPNLN